MATYHQYSEIVAAYGYKLPPARPESLRVGLSLLYAAVGVALGTLTGTALAVVSTQPGAAAMRHFRFAHSATAALSAPAANTNAYAIVSPSIHPLANLTIQHAAANESFRPVVGATLQPIVNASIRPLVSAGAGVAAAAPAIHSVAAAPRAELSSVLKPALVRSATPLKPYLVHRQTAVKHVTMTISAMATSTMTTSGTTVSGTTQPITVAAMVAEAAQSTTALAAAPPVAPTILSFPTAAAQTGLDARPAVYYSEGDVTVADYDAVAGTIQTTDGKIFLIGPTVSVSDATSWGEYRANVHYRCNQSGSCMLVRAGVVALNAKMI